MLTALLSSSLFCKILNPLLPSCCIYLWSFRPLHLLSFPNPPPSVCHKAYTNTSPTHSVITWMKWALSCVIIAHTVRAGERWWLESWRQRMGVQEGGEEGVKERTRRMIALWFKTLREKHVSMFSNISFNIANEPWSKIQQHMTSGLWEDVYSTWCDRRSCTDLPSLARSERHHGSPTQRHAADKHQETLITFNTSGWLLLETWQSAGVCDIREQGDPEFMKLKL